MCTNNFYTCVSNKLFVCPVAAIFAWCKNQLKKYNITYQKLVNKSSNCNFWLKPECRSDFWKKFPLQFLCIFFIYVIGRKWVGREVVRCVSCSIRGKKKNKRKNSLFPFVCDFLEPGRSVIGKFPENLQINTYSFWG